MNNYDEPSYFEFEASHLVNKQKNVQINLLTR